MAATRKISTEDPNAEQWRMLLQFSYEPNIRRSFKKRGFPDPSSDIIEYITGSIRQADAYFTATRQSTLDISPLLMYYGTANLFAGAAALVLGKIPVVESHGMKLQFPSSSKGYIADVEIKIKNHLASALRWYCETFTPLPELPSQEIWTLNEIFGSLPDLKTDFNECYQEQLIYVIPVEIVQQAGLPIERLKVADFGPRPNPGDDLTAVPGFRAAYLTPMQSSNGEYINLRRKMDADEIGTYSLFGKKFLQLSHFKQNKNVVLEQIIAIYMGLFALGHISRYFPQKWNPFVHTDNTGERLVVERYLEISSRFLPNLVLNIIYGERIQFVNEFYEGFDRASFFDEEQVRTTVRKYLREEQEEKGF